MLVLASDVMSARYPFACACTARDPAKFAHQPGRTEALRTLPRAAVSRHAVLLQRAPGRVRAWYIASVLVTLPIPSHIDGRLSCVQPAHVRQNFTQAEQVRALTLFERLQKATAVRHHHPELEINLVLKGDGSYACGEQRVPVRAGTLLWIAPGTEHVLLEPSPDLELWVIIARAGVVGRAAPDEEARGLLSSPYQLRHLSAPQTQKLCAVFADVLAQVGRNHHILNQGLTYAVARACASLGDPAELPDERTVHPAVFRAARILREEPQVERLDAVARRSGISSDHLTRIFAAQMGLSLSEFRNRARLERFLEIYGIGRRYTLTQAALEAGFGSYAQFQRVFKQQCGQSPAQYARGRRA